MMDLFGPLNLSEMMTESLMEEIMVKYHFQDVREEMHQAYTAVRSAIKDQERYEVLLDRELMQADIVVTLGGLIDKYQEKLAKEDDIMKELMVEQISWDLLAQGYKMIRDNLCEFHGLTMDKMHFWGGEPDYPLEGLIDVLKRFQHLDISLSHALSLSPSKSAVFRAHLLLAEEEAVEHGLCTTCNRQERCEYYDNRLSD